jgi:hypothetical protein
MSNEKQQTAKETLEEAALSFLPHSEVDHDTDFIIGFEFGSTWQAERMYSERMRSYIEEKWKQYRIVTNEEDAWLFKEWLIQQTYGGNK